MFDDILGPYVPKPIAPDFGEEQYPDPDYDVEEPRSNVASMTGSIKRGMIKHHDNTPNSKPWNTGKKSWSTGNRQKGVWKT